MKHLLCKNLPGELLKPTEFINLYLSLSFLCEIYDGQLFIKLKKGLNLPAMDPWGTSDPYVVFQLDSQVVKSTVKWGDSQQKSYYSNAY
ncbi:hypothetical protein CsSME_00033859 [Camellia sinensis var. sinensis]